MSDLAIAAPKRARFSWGGGFVSLCFVLLALLPPLAHWLDQPFLLRQFIQIMVMGLAAMSLDLILGFGGLVSFGHALFVGLGAYAVGSVDISCPLIDASITRAGDIHIDARVTFTY